MVLAKSDHSGQAAAGGDVTKMKLWERGLTSRSQFHSAQCPNWLPSPRSTSSQGAQCTFRLFPGPQSRPCKRTLRSQYPQPPDPHFCPLLVWPAGISKWLPSTPASSSCSSSLPGQGLQGRSSTSFVLGASSVSAASADKLTLHNVTGKGYFFLGHVNIYVGKDWFPGRTLLERQPPRK